MTQVTREAIDAALAGVDDPEIRRPITELGMVKGVEVDGSTVRVGVYLTVSSCPMQDTITNRVREAVGGIDGVESVQIELDVMSDEQRKALREQLQGPQKEIPFNKPSAVCRSESWTATFTATRSRGSSGWIAIPPGSKACSCRPPPTVCRSSRC